MQVRLLVALGALVAVGYGIAAPALPTFARSLDAGIAGASVLVGAFGAVRVAAAPLGGRLVRRLGERGVFCGGLLVVGLSSAACTVAADFRQLLVFRAAGGVGSVMFTVSAAALLVRLAPPRMRGRASAAWSGGFLLGAVAGPLLGGLLAEVSLRLPFLCYAVLLGVAAAVAAAVLEVPAGDGATTAGGAPRLLGHPVFRAALVANLLQGWTVYGVRLALVPLYVGEVLHRSNAWAGAALTALAAGTVAALPVGGRWADRYGRRAPVLAGAATVAVTAVWLGTAGSLAELLTAAALSGAGTGLMTPPVNAAVADLVARRGRVADGGPLLAGYQMVGDAGAVVGPVVAGVVAERFGYAKAFATVSVIAAATFLCWWRAPETTVQ